MCSGLLQSAPSDSDASQRLGRRGAMVHLGTVKLTTIKPLLQCVSVWSAITSCQMKINKESLSIKGFKKMHLNLCAEKWLDRKAFNVVSVLSMRFKLTRSHIILHIILLIVQTCFLSFWLKKNLFTSLVRKNLWKGTQIKALFILKKNKVCVVCTAAWLLASHFS